MRDKLIRNTAERSNRNYSERESNNINYTEIVNAN